jgi:pimeloyl-ACP methyl ester carboxylesterase
VTTLVQPKSMRMSVNGLNLHYLDWGNVGAPPVVCVHGYTSSAEAFNALARHFHDRFHIVAPDVRGHGESAWSPDGAYQYRDQVSDLAKLVDQLGLTRFTLIGTSMGGIIAVAFAAAHAARLAGLVINDIGPDVEGGSQRITQTVGSRPEEFETLEAAMVYRREVSPATATRPMSDQREVALGVLRQRTDGRWVWKMDPAYIRQRVHHGAPPRPALWPVLKSLPCPTLVVWGTESDVLLEAQARRMVGVLPRGELVTVPGVAHAPTLVEPVVLAALEPFLSCPGNVARLRRARRRDDHGHREVQAPFPH